MSYKRTMVGVGELCQKELDMASEKFGATHASAHEGYAVILEEYEEACYEIDGLKDSMEWLWGCVKDNDLEGTKHFAETIKLYAMAGACELIQVGAMAQKMIDTVVEANTDAEEEESKRCTNCKHCGFVESEDTYAMCEFFHSKTYACEERALYCTAWEKRSADDD